MKKILWLLVLILACEGPTGPQGEQGLTGETGEQGLPGVANISTVTFSFTTADISVNGASGVYTKNISQITADVVSKGLVLVYADVGGVWIPLPISDNYDYTNNLEVDKVVFTTFVYSTGSLTIGYYTSYSSLITTDFFTGPYKAVIIPPASLAKYLASNSI